MVPKNLVHLPKWARHILARYLAWLAIQRKYLWIVSHGMYSNIICAMPKQVIIKSGLCLRADVCNWGPEFHLIGHWSMLANLTQNWRTTSCFCVWFFDLSLYRKLVAGRHPLKTWKQKVNCDMRFCATISSESWGTKYLSLWNFTEKGNSYKWLQVFSKMADHLTLIPRPSSFSKVAVESIFTPRGR